MSIKLQFTDQDWERISKDWSAWWAGELERPLSVIEVWDSPCGEPPAVRRQFANWFPLDTPVDVLLDQYQRHLESRLFLGDAWPKWWPNFGPGIGAGYLGAQVLAAEDTVWYEPAERLNIGEIRPGFDPENVWWQRTLALTRGAVDRWGDQVGVGFTDLGGNLDILVSLHTTQRLATELYDQPQEVLRLVREINDTWVQYYDGLYEIIQLTGRGTTPWAPIWSPKRTYMLQSDFSFMISPPMFEQFVMPDLEACCAHLDHAFYHMDGIGQLPHLDMLLSIENLRGVQWIPGAGQPPLEEWLKILQRIRQAGKLNQVFVTPEGARTIVREIGGRGFVFGFEDYLKAEEVEPFLKALAAEDIGEIGMSKSIHLFGTPRSTSSGEPILEPGADEQSRLSAQEEAILDDIFNHTLDGQQALVIETMENGLAMGIAPSEMLFDAMIPALEEVGRLFEMGEYFVPEMLISARAFQSGLDRIRPLLAQEDMDPLGTFVMGTVQGDIHDIGKNLVNILLEGSGFNVVDLGVNVPPEAFVEAIQIHQPDVVGMSAFLTTTLPMLGKSIEAIESAGLRGQVKILIGGAPVTQEYCERVKADGFAADASKAVRVTKQLLGISN